MGSKSAPSPPPIVYTPPPEYTSPTETMAPMMEMMMGMMNSMTESMGQMSAGAMPVMPEIQMPDFADMSIEDEFNRLKEEGQDTALGELENKRGMESTVLTSLLDEDEANIVQGSVLAGPQGA